MRGGEKKGPGKERYTNLLRTNATMFPKKGMLQNRKIAVKMAIVVDALWANLLDGGTC